MQPVPSPNPGDILQIRPGAERYGGQFCVFVAPRDTARAKVYLTVRKGVIYLNFGWEDLARTDGRVVWRPASTVSNREPDPRRAPRPPAAASPSGESHAFEGKPAWRQLDEVLPELARRHAHG